MSEITISGGGIFGLTLAFLLLERGHRVQVYEKRRIGAGASGGLVGALAPHTPDNWNDKKAFQLKSLLKTGPFWQRVDAISGQNSGYFRSGRLQTIPDQRAHDLASGRAAEAEARWEGHAHWRIVPISSKQNWGLTGPGDVLIEDTLSALINPRAALRGLAQAVEKLGGIIHENSLRPADDTCPHVQATGYEGLAAQGLGQGQKGQGALLRFDANGLPQLFCESVHFIPHLNGTVAIGSTSENTWQHENTDYAIDDLVAKARRICPVLADAPVLETWAGFRPKGQRRAPILGQLPGSSDYILNGGFKIGFGVVVEAAEQLADLILTGKADIPESFRPEANL